MKIVFFPVGCVPFHGKFLEERPFGGMETAIIRLAEALDALGHEVCVLSDLSNLPASRPRYLPVQQANKLGEFDILIVIRGVQGLLLPFRCKRRLYWSGDPYTSLQAFGLGDHRIIRATDLFLAVSEWHLKTTCQASGFPEEKAFVLRNGICLSHFEGEEKRQPKRLIYSSSPQRGLEYLVEIFLELRRRHSDAELLIFGSMGVVGREWPPVNLKEMGCEKIFEKLQKLPGCHIYSPLPQHRLAREFMKAAIWAYPTQVEETSCITAMEAQAGGAVPVTTALGALPETVGDAGILLEGNAGTKTYCDKFVEVCDHLFSDCDFFQKFSLKGRERALEFDWKLRALTLIQELQNRFGLS